MASIETKYTVINVSTGDTHLVPDVLFLMEGTYLECRRFLAERWLKASGRGDFASGVRVNLATTGGPFDLGYLEVIDNANGSVDQYIVTPAK